jgi:TonB family protein
MRTFLRALFVSTAWCASLSYGWAQAKPASSLLHYRTAEEFFRLRNYQSAANEYNQALNGDLDEPWTKVWSYIGLGRIFDATGQHDRAVREYQSAQQTGDNTDGGLDEANRYLMAEHLLPIGVPIQKIDPEYTEEARLAGLEGTVLLHAVIGEDGLARDVTVLESLGLGLDEKAVDAVTQWHFQAIASAPRIRVDFHLPSQQSRWHLIGVRFDAPPGVTRPAFVSAEYPVGPGIGPEAMEEGRLVAAMGRLATATLAFDIDEHGVPVHFQISHSSEKVWGPEASALVRAWRFAPATKLGIPVTVACTMQLVWGRRDLDFAALEKAREAMDEEAVTAKVFPPPVEQPDQQDTARIWVDAQEQASKVLINVPPRYPPTAPGSSVAGMVRFHVLIGVDGRVRQADWMSGDPAFKDAASEAVKQWVYRTTLLNGTPVEVTTEVDIDAPAAQ